MSSLVLGLLIGLFVGWNVLPQPAWVAAIYARWFGS